MGVFEIIVIVFSTLIVLGVIISSVYKKGKCSDCDYCENCSKCKKKGK